jgi:predicted AAA+ superfamily ATPase
VLRFASRELDAWFKSPNRKPMALRGARQVGKTWLVRDFAVRNNLRLIELNLEKFPNLADLFSENNPAKILKNIEAYLNIKINIESSCLFLDEIQAAPKLFAKLRWFKEDMPQLPVIAAGSLLEIALSKANYSMPVGRVTYFYLEPLSFFEFVLALGNEGLYEKLLTSTPGKVMPEILHSKSMDLYQEYCLVGGMPESIQTWLDSKEPQACLKIQHDLLATYRDDFHKYGGEMDARLLNRILLSVAEQLGNKFVYSLVDPGLQISLVKKAIGLMFQAKVCSRVAHTSGNGLPLGAESNEKFFKALMVDVGLVSAQLGLTTIQQPRSEKRSFSNKGGLAEQFVGQQLRAAQGAKMDPQLFYWQRTGGRLGEIDYVLQHGNTIIPVEVKSGATGAMKSLHQFMAEKGLSLAVRVNAKPLSLEKVRLKTTLGWPVTYRLLSIPFYLSEHLGTLIDQVQT